MIDLRMTEAQFLECITDTATLTGWLYMHIRPSIVRNGRWATAQSGSPGFPDLVLARDGVVHLAETKSQKGRLRPGQGEWITAAGEHGHLWRPSDWPEIQTILRRRR